MNPIKLSYLYLRRHLFVTTVTIISLSLAIVSVTILLKLEILSNSRFKSLAEQGNAIVGAKSGGIDILLGALNFEGEVPPYLPQNLYETLKAKKDISFEDKTGFKDSFNINYLTPLLMFGKYNGFNLVGTENTILNSPSLQPQLQEGQFPENNNETMIGTTVADSESLKIGDTLLVHGRIYNSLADSPTLKLKVVGILKPTSKVWDRGIYTNLATAQSTVSQTLGYQTIWGSHVLSYFLLNIKPGGEDALSTLINQRTVGQLVFTEKEKKHLEELTGSSETLQYLIVGILLLLSSLTVLAVFFIRMEARSLELAVLRALGYSRKDLTTLTLFEGLWMGTVSIFFAGLLELIINPIILNTAGAHLPAPNSSNWPWWMIFVTGFFALIAIITACLPPLIRLYKQDVHSTLRSIS